MHLGSTHMHLRTFSPSSNRVLVSLTSALDRASAFVILRTTIPWYAEVMSSVCAVFHYLVTEGGAQGKVVGIEHIPELVDFSVDNLKEDGLGPALDDGRLVIVTGDGRKGCFSIPTM
jgi:hypothetical protein